MKNRIFRFIILAAIGFAFGGLLAYLDVKRDSVDTVRNDAEKKIMATATPFGGDFTLVSETGETVTPDTWAGQYKLVFFGFTHCPDICPAAMEKFSLTLDNMGEAAENIAPLFITVDPARDTVDVMKSYTDAYDPRIIGLTGTENQIAHAIEEYKVYAAKDEAETATAAAEEAVEHAHMHHADMGHGHEAMDTTPAMPPAEHAYLMQHSAYFYLMGPDNEFITIMRSEDSVAEIESVLKQHL